jgi:hypothetical protein
MLIMNDCLDFIASVTRSIAWPATAVVIGVVFRAPIGRLIDRVRTFKNSLGEVGLDAAAESANARIGSVGAALVAVSDEPAALPLPEAGPTVTSGGAVGSATEIQRRRDEVELLVQQGARWGWAVSRSDMFSSAPYPVLQWDDAGRPKIAYATTDPAASAVLRIPPDSPALSTGFATIRDGCQEPG